MNKIFLTIFLLLACNIFANENIYNFMLKNNMKYPYNIKAIINESYYIDRTENAKVDEDGYIIPIELTNDQRKTVEKFFEMLKSISESGYFDELKNQSGIIAFSIENVNIYKDNGSYVFIGVWITYYSDKKLGDMSIYGVTTICSPRFIKMRVKVTVCEGRGAGVFAPLFHVRHGRRVCRKTLFYDRLELIIFFVLKLFSKLVICNYRQPYSALFPFLPAVKRPISSHCTRPDICRDYELCNITAIDRSPYLYPAK